MVSSRDPTDGGSTGDVDCKETEALLTSRKQDETAVQCCLFVCYHKHFDRIEMHRNSGELTISEAVIETHTEQSDECLIPAINRMGLFKLHIVKSFSHWLKVITVVRVAHG
ncbi:unnamed protein product [Echinostoma caproni]|uniref:Uncharacterized protein n=1 Tax=Echinostoma caproni TaxID=27848 RepID=A0A183AGC6_9TREM|nr:unnamed protein product [Echinostoma caproni]